MCIQLNQTFHTATCPGQNGPVHCSLLSWMSTESRGGGSSELPGISFVARWNVTLMTEQGKAISPSLLLSCYFTTSPFKKCRSGEISGHISHLVTLKSLDSQLFEMRADAGNQERKYGFVSKCEKPGQRPFKLRDQYVWQMKSCIDFMCTNRSTSSIHHFMCN